MTETLNAKKNKIPIGPVSWVSVNVGRAGALWVATEERGLGAPPPFLVLMLVSPPTL